MNKDRGEEKSIRITKEDAIVCPYCGHEHDLNSDYFENDSEYEDDSFQCYECELYFEVTAEVRFEFWATSKELPEDERR